MQIAEEVKSSLKADQKDYKKLTGTEFYRIGPIGPIDLSKPKF